MAKETDETAHAEQPKDTALSESDARLTPSGAGFWDNKSKPSACSLGVAPPAEDNPYKR